MQTKDTRRALPEGREPHASYLTATLGALERAESARDRCAEMLREVVEVTDAWQRTVPKPQLPSGVRVALERARLTVSEVGRG